MRLFEGTEFDIPPTCDRCEKLEEDCKCEPLPEVIEYLPPDGQTARVKSEKRKRGKVVTVISGLAPDESDLQALLKILKDHCGAGGTVKNDTIEIQGEQSERIEKKLSDIGYRVKRG